LALLKEGARQEDRQAMAARVAEAEAALNLANVLMGKATVESPIGGVLDKRYCEVGEYVKPGTPLADIVNTDRVKVVAAVPEKDISFVRTGDPITVVFDALNLRRTGNAMFQSRAADRDTLTFDVKVELDNPDGRIRPGMIARAVLVRRKLTAAVKVPIFAVIKREKGYVAFVEDAGTARERPLTLGFFEAHRVVVTSGLKPGDRLIVQGQRDLVDGDKVRVPEPATTAPADRRGGERP